MAVERLRYCPFLQEQEKGKRKHPCRRKVIFEDHPVAYVPQENPLVEELSVRDNLLLWYKGDRKKMEKDLADGPAAILGISQMLKKTAGQLSGGMKKRLSIACSLALGSRYLIMDEPGAALDLECRR